MRMILERPKAGVQTVVSMMARARERSFFPMAAVKAVLARGGGMAEETLFGFGVLYWAGGVLGLGIGLRA